jgi:type II secretory pathway pseudopilin PulG
MTTGDDGTDRDDAGLTLIDVVVAMTLMSVVLMIVTTGVVDMYRTANRADTAADSQSRILAAFNRLDRQIRYAERIMVDDSDATHWVAEFSMKDSANVRQCVQLRLPKATGGALTSQQWPAASSTTPTGTATTIAADVTRPSSAPFTLIPAGTANSNFDRLAVTVSVRTGSATGSRAQIRDFDLQFTALNTVASSVDLNGCATL